MALFGWFGRWLIADKLKQLDAIERALPTRMHGVYSTVQTFRGRDSEYYSWIRSFINAPEYGFMMFELRENVVREMVQCRDNRELPKYQGMITMLQIMDAYLEKGLTQYEEAIVGSEKKSPKG